MAKNIARANLKKIFHDTALPKINDKIKIRNREFLAGSKSHLYPKYLTKQPNNKLKIATLDESLKTKSKLLEVGKFSRDLVDENIDETPAIIMKGLPIETIEDFNTFATGVGYETLGYHGGVAFREQHEENVYAASDEPSNLSIEPHNEMSYLNTSPNKIMFCCIEKPMIGGETPIVFNHDIMQDLRQDVLDKFAQKQIKYSRNLPHEKDSGYLTWQTTLKTKSQKEAEEHMRRLKINWTWNDDGSLTYWHVLSAFRAHPKTKDMIWFNQATPAHYSYYRDHPDYAEKRHYLKPHQYPFDTAYGDGEEIAEEILDHIRAVTWSNAIPIKLDKGDVIMLDNYLVQHSRISYEGYRKVVVQIIKD